MGMNSYLLEAARRSDCLFALLPCNGGSVISPLRQDTGVYPVKNTRPDGSWAERNGLIELKNILYQDNVFSSFDESAIAQINTPLDFKGNNKSKTFIGKFKILRAKENRLYIHPFFSQGYFPGGKNDQVFNFTLWENATNKYLSFDMTMDDGSRLSTTYIVDVDFFDKEHILAAVYDINYEENTTKIYLYSDQKLLKRITKNMALPWTTTPHESYYNYPAAIRTDVDLRYKCNDKLFWAMIFDSALPAEEIVMFK
jgi:hypothetical protein